MFINDDRKDVYTVVNKGEQRKGERSKMAILTAKCDRMFCLSDKKAEKFLKQKNNINKEKVDSILSVISKNTKFNQGNK